MTDGTCLQTSHDAHGTVLDGLEDSLTSHEIKSAASLVSGFLGLGLHVLKSVHCAVACHPAVSHSAWQQVQIPQADVRGTAASSCSCAAACEQVCKAGLAHLHVHENHANHQQTRLVY